MPTPECLISDSGYLHLSPAGWVRKDEQPFPANRLETWRYEMERPAADAKERVHLTRIWADPGVPGSRIAGLHAQFGDAVAARKDRHVVLDCRV